jgi:hypothetical protein
MRTSCEEETGLPFSIAGKNRHVCSVCKITRFNVGSGVGLTSATVAVPSARMSNLASASVSLARSRNSSGIFGSGLNITRAPVRLVWAGARVSGVATLACGGEGGIGGLELAGSSGVCAGSGGALSSETGRSTGRG